MWVRIAGARFEIVLLMPSFCGEGCEDGKEDRRVQSPVIAGQDYFVCRIGNAPTRRLRRFHLRRLVAT